MFTRLLVKHGNRKLQAEAERLREEVAELQTMLAEERSRLRVKDVEIESLAAVVARDRERVKAETATYARGTAAVEN